MVLTSGEVSEAPGPRSGCCSVSSQRARSQSEAAAVACSERVAAHEADPDRLVVLRDSKDPDGPRLYFTPAEWNAFRLDVRDGKFDGLSR